MNFYFLLETLNEEEQHIVLTIYEKYNRLIYAIAYEILKNKHDTEDTLNNVMINIMNNLDKFTGVSDELIKNQICVYTRNSALNYAAKNNRKKNNEVSSDSFVLDDDNTFTDMKDESFNLEEIVINSELRNYLLKEISELPTILSDTLNLVYYMGYSNNEAAKVLGITPSTVGMRLMRARAILKEKIGGYLNEHTDK